MNDDIVTRLRDAGFCGVETQREAADEIGRLRKIIRDFYFEEEKYQDYMNQDFMDEYIIPQSWKDAYTAFEKEARKIEFGDEWGFFNG